MASTRTRFTVEGADDEVITGFGSNRFDGTAFIAVARDESVEEAAIYLTPAKLREVSAHLEQLAYELELDIAFS